MEGVVFTNTGDGGTENPAPGVGPQREPQSQHPGAIENPLVLCAWCCKVIRDGNPDVPVSHGICDPCASQFLKAEVECVFPYCTAEAWREDLCKRHWLLLTEMRYLEAQQTLAQAIPVVACEEKLPIWVMISAITIFAMALTFLGIVIGRAA